MYQVLVAGLKTLNKTASESISVEEPLQPCNAIKSSPLISCTSIDLRRFINNEASCSRGDTVAVNDHIVSEV